MVEFGASDFDLKAVAGRIKTYTEERDGSQIATIRAAINSAQVIVVLGFGFHRQNVELLDIREASEAWKELFMTVMGIDEQNHRTMRNRMAESFKAVSHVSIAAVSSGEFLRKLQPSIGFAIS